MNFMLHYLESTITSHPYLLKKWYDIISTLDKNADLTYINFGFKSVNKKHSDVPDHLKHQLAMYQHVIHGTVLRNKKIVEIGSGRGGGAYFITQHYHPQIYIGLDFSSKAINFCQTRLSLKNLQFMVGDAQKVPLENEIADIVINIESAQLYNNIFKFIDEVYRIMRPQGFFLIAFNYPKHKFPGVLSYFKKKKFLIIKKENITKQVLAAMKSDETTKKQLIEKKVPYVLRSGFKAFVGVEGSSSYELMKSGKVQYIFFKLQKL